MGIDVLRDQKVWFGAYDLTGKMNSIGLAYGAPLLDADAFGNTGKERLSGLPAATAQHEGYWDEVVDAALFAEIGQVNTPMSVAPVNGTEGSRVHFFHAAAAEYSSGGDVGDIYRFSVSAEGSGGEELISGTLMANRSAAAASGNSAARQLGAVASGQKLFAALHVTAVAGGTPTLDVTVESDDGAGFASPTTRMTFSQKTAIGFEWPTPVAGAISDDWWRIDWTIGGTAPLIDFAVMLGIQ